VKFNKTKKEAQSPMPRERKKNKTVPQKETRLAILLKKMLAEKDAGNIQEAERLQEECLRAFYEE